MARNVEWKGRLADPAAARRIASRLATSHAGIERQVDTYFRVSKGRLKLREIESASGRSAELIYYQRANSSAAKTSNYERLPLEQGQMIWKELLTHALGIVTQVVKSREIWWHKNVRIHLDQVADLGDYLEFEAVLGSEDDPSLAASVLERLIKDFALEPFAGIAVSYCDLMLMPREGHICPQG